MNIYCPESILFALISISWQLEPRRLSLPPPTTVYAAAPLMLYWDLKDSLTMLPNWSMKCLNHGMLIFSQINCVCWHENYNDSHIIVLCLTYQAMKNYNYDEDPLPASCGITIEKQLAQVQGCVLEAPKVCVIG